MTGHPVAMVTGAGGELGRAMVVRLLAAGYTVLALDIDKAGLDATVAQAGTGAAVQACVVDLGDADAIAGVFAEIEEVTLLVNNAAIYPATPFDLVQISEYDRVVAVNQRAYFLMAQHAAHRMFSGSSIVNIASITVHGGWEHLAAYVSTKGAAIALTRALARELGPRGIRVNAVSPGAIPTQAERIIPDRAAYEEHVLGRQSLKRRGTPQDIAAVVAFLASSDASFITGQTMEVDGGWVMI
jgi:NAD(P)-dependent dehydrogenase (short-subunit alcohol dehydrogenase family)